jgi:hypothetical protein
MNVEKIDNMMDGHYQRAGLPDGGRKGKSEAERG